MPKIKPPEFEDRPAIAESDPDDRFPPGARYTRVFKFASVTAVVSVLFSNLMPVTSGDALGLARAECVGVFCVLVCLFLQASCAWQQRYHTQTRRARVYFWLLALFPVWGIPVAYALTTVITWIGFWIAKNT